jgi:guanylate kinase
VEGSEAFVFSVSATTRPAREGERDGVDYDFVDVETFERMAANGELVEWAEVHGHLYGTPRRNIEEPAARGQHVVLDIDVQGARQIRERVPEALLIFVLPPSAEALVQRLSGRGTEGRAEMVRRLRNARTELSEATEFDHAVVNEDVSTALETIKALVEGEGVADALVRGDVGAIVRDLREAIDDILAGEPTSGEDRSQRSEE